MCYSAPASFSAAAVLAISGYFTLKTIKSSRYLPIALIPCGFALQQAAEGMVWLNIPLQNGDWLAYLNVWIFAFFSFVLWPFWVPLAFSTAEKDPKRKWMMQNLLMVGVAIAIFNAYLGIIHGIRVDMTCNSLAYSSSGISYAFYYGITVFYVACTIGPMLLSTLKGIAVVGILGLIAFILCFVIQRETFSSLWCFYAALINCGLWWVLKNNR